MQPKNSYIVVFKKDTPKNVIDKAMEDVKAQGGSISHVYDTVLLGFAATLPDNLMTAFKTNAHVETVEKDSQVSICGV